MTANSSFAPRRAATALRRRAARAVDATNRRLGRARGAATAADARSLNEIGLATGTDKASRIHDYLGVYERVLGGLRDQRFKMIEIGVHQGASLRMWEQFFPHARIIGVDIDPRCRRFAGDRVTVRIGDQGDERFLERLAGNHRPMLVVDDGSHRWRHQIDTFRALWPSLRPGGFFVLEDIHTSFGEDYAHTYGTSGGETAYDYIAGICEGIVAGPRAQPAADEFETYCRATIESVVSLRHSVILRKKPHPQPWYTRASVADVAPQAWIHDLGPAYERIPADVVNAPDGVGDALRRLVESGPVSFPPAASADLRDVAVHGFGPATVDGTILSETLNCAQNVRFTSGLYRPRGDKHWVRAAAEATTRHRPRPDGRRRVLLKHTWDRNYGHWLLDTLPKIGLLDGHLALDECAFVVGTQPTKAMERVVRDSLALAGVRSEDQIEFVGAGINSFDQLVVLGTTSRHPVAKSRFTIRWLEQFAADVPPGDHDRLYVSRNAYGRRRLVNEEDVLGLLEGFGYHRVQPEEMTLSEQVATFRGAGHVIGNLGAALSNLAFSPAGVSVLALTTEQMKHDFFYDIVCHKEGRYRGLQGRSVIAAGSRPDLSTDFEIDLDHLAACLTWLHPNG